MAVYDVRFEGARQESFDELDDAIEWAEEVAATGRTVDVVRRRLGLFLTFVTAFPESERAGRRAKWSAVPWLAGGGEFVGSGGGFDGGAGGGGDGGGC